MKRNDVIVERSATADSDTPRIRSGAISGAVEAPSTPAHGQHPNKPLRTLQARAALVGIELVRLGDGSLLAMKWGWCKSLADEAAAARWLDVVGAPR